MLNHDDPLDRAFQALADPSRRAIVERLTAGPASVSELARPLAMSFPAVMQHLAVLEGAALVASQKTGRVRVCRLEAAALDRVEAWLTARRAEWERRFDRLGHYLEELQQEGGDHDDPD
jgi:DNA-binding transcriptional ArsR family regulator